jgi:hypothetical protein
MHMASRQRLKVQSSLRRRRSSLSLDSHRRSRRDSDEEKSRGKKVLCASHDDELASLRS